MRFNFFYWKGGLRSVGMGCVGEVVVAAVVVGVDVREVDGDDDGDSICGSKIEKPARVPAIWVSAIFKTLRLGNWLVVAICGMESPVLSERLRVWRLWKMCGALNNGSMFLILVSRRSKATRCWKMGWDKTFMHSSEPAMGVLERLRWAREGEKGMWTKLTNG